MGLAVLIGLIVYVLVAIVVAKAVQKKSDSKLAAYLTIGVFVLIPTWDIIPGWTYFSYLCNTADGQQIYRTIEIGPEYLLKPGDPDRSKSGVPPAAGGEINWAKLQDHYPIASIEREKLFNIKTIVYFISDGQTDEVLGTSTSFRYYGGWLYNNMGLEISPWECPNSPADSNYVHSTLKFKLFKTPPL